MEPENGPMEKHVFLYNSVVWGSMLIGMEYVYDQ